MLQKLYALHWISDQEHDAIEFPESSLASQCQPDFFIAKMLPLGQSVGCIKPGCEGKWVLASTEDASKALVKKEE